MIEVSPKQADTMVKIRGGFNLSVNDGRCTATISDTLTKEIWTSATGETMQDAFNNAVASLGKDATAPKSVVRSAAAMNSLTEENEKLREQIASMTAMSEKAFKKIAPKDP